MKFKRFSDLSEKEIVSLKKAILNGDSSRSIAKGLQKKGYYKDVKLSTLQRQIQRYKEILHFDAELDVCVNKRIDPTNELKRLFCIQSQRVNQLCYREQINNDYHSSILREIQGAVELISLLQKLPPSEYEINDPRGNPVLYECDVEKLMESALADFERIMAM